MKKTSLALLSFCFLFMLSGCWDQKEVEEQAYVIAIGIDLPEDVDIEEEQAIDVTFQFSNPKLNVKGVSPSESENEDNITLTAPDLVSARNMANSFVTREISFAHNKVLIISEKLAKSDVFFRILSTTIKDPEVRRETSLIVTEGKASDFIKKNKPELMIRAHRYYQFLIDRATETGLVPESTLNRFFAITDADADLFLAMYGSPNSEKVDFNDEDKYVAGQVPKKGGNPVQLIGSAVFKEGKMIGKLTGEETRITRMLDNTSNVQDMYSSFQDPLDKKYKITVKLKKEKETEVKVKIRKDAPPIINVKYPVEIEVLSVPSMVTYGDNLKNQKVLKQYIEQKMKENAEKLIEKTQKEFKSEPFYWSLYVRPLFKTVKEYETWDWTNKNYPFAEINVNMDVKITGFGKQLKGSDINRVID